MKKLESKDAQLRFQDNKTWVWINNWTAIMGKGFFQVCRIPFRRHNMNREETVWCKKREKRVKDLRCGVMVKTQMQEGGRQELSDKKPFNDKDDGAPKWTEQQDTKNKTGTRTNQVRKREPGRSSDGRTQYEPVRGKGKTRQYIHSGADDSHGDEVKESQEQRKQEHKTTQ